MKRLLVFLHVLSYTFCFGQASNGSEESSLINRVLLEPSSQEQKDVLTDLRSQDLTPKRVAIHDTVLLTNSNKLYILSHELGGVTHFGAVIIPPTNAEKKLPIVVFVTGGDGMHKQFDISKDFNHPAAQFPSLLGDKLDSKCIVIIPCLRGQQLIFEDRSYQSEGKVSDAFDGATTDALAFLNVALETFRQADERRIAIYGGSRGGTVALLASARDKRIKRTISVAAPTDMTALYQLYPDQFKLLFFNDLLAGNISESEARKKFISISPIYFTSELPLVQIHHDYNDPFVPVELSKVLSERIKAQGKNVEAYFYDEGIHGFWDDESFWDRVQEFIGPLTE